MIDIRGLALARDGARLEPMSLQVRGGELVFLLERQGLGPLYAALSGRRPADGGEALFSGGQSAAPPAVFIDRVEAVADYETEASLGDWIEFLCTAGGIDRAGVFKTLLVCNIHERQLKKRARDLAAEVFQQVCLALCLAGGAPNLVIHDFIRGAGKGFEMKFNKLMLGQKALGRAILYLGSDIFYASQVADRVGFVKDGRLLFEADAADLQEMDLKGLYLQFLN